MRQLIPNFIRGSRFARNVTTVAVGVGTAQLIAIAFTPVITRIYGPEAFGILGVFMAISTIVVPVSSLTYPIAIVIPESHDEARALGRLSIIVSSIVAIVFAAMLLAFGNLIARFPGITAIEPYLYLFPLVMLLATSLQVAQQSLIRKKLFKLTAKIAASHSLILNGLKAGLGWIYPTATMLIVLSIFGTLLHVLMLAAGSIRQQIHPGKRIQADDISIKTLAKKYCDFPLYRAPQVLINTASHGLPVLMLAALYGPAAAGFYTIGRTVLGLPAQLIGNSVGDVFSPRIAEAAIKKENLGRLILKATIGLAAIGAMPFGAVVILGPWLFGVVFGAEWGVAGEYARWMAVWLFFGFINRPSVIAVPVLNLQLGLLIYEIFSTSLKIVLLLMGFYFFESDIWAVALFSAGGAVTYIYLIAWVIGKATNKRSAMATR